MPSLQTPTHQKFQIFAEICQKNGLGSREGYGGLENPECGKLGHSHKLQSLSTFQNSKISLLRIAQNKIFGFFGDNSAQNKDFELVFGPNYRKFQGAFGHIKLEGNAQQGLRNRKNLGEKGKDTQQK